MGDLSLLIESDTEDVIDVLQPKTRTASVVTKFAGLKQLARIHKPKPYPKVAQVRPDDGPAIPSPEIHYNDVSTIYNPTPYYNDGTEAEEAIPTDCERAEIVRPAPKMNSNYKWAGVYIILAICLVVGSVLFTVRIHVDMKENHGVINPQRL